MFVYEVGMSDDKQKEEAKGAITAPRDQENEANELVEVSAWDEQDAIVKRGAKEFVKVGLALIEIRKSKLYEEGGFKSFGDYVKDRIDMSEQQTLKLRNAAQIYIELEKEGVEVLPTKESQIRVLAKFKKSKYKEDRKKIWQESVNEAKEKGTPVTAKLVEAKAREIVPERFVVSDKAAQKAKQDTQDRIKGLKQVLAYLETCQQQHLIDVFKSEHGKELGLN